MVKICRPAGVMLAMAMLAQPALADSAYRIHADDVLTVGVFGEPTLSETVRVLNGGTISLPLAGNIAVGGLTAHEAEQRVAKAYAAYVRHPDVSINVTTEGNVNVLVLGAVKLPGKYPLPATARLTDAIAAAGGLAPIDGALPDARLSVDGAVQTASLQGLLRRGDTTQNLPLANEETVYVPSPVLIDIHVLGAVDKPGDVEIPEGDRLSMAVARAGESPNANADLNHIVVRRVAADGTVTVMNVNMYEVLKSNDLQKDPVLLKDDLVYIPSAGGKKDSVSPAAAIFIALRTLVGIP